MVAGKSVAILGGGLAGLSAALALAEQEFRVSLFERKPFLGGRATSYPVVDQNQENEDSEAREFVDNCQHVVLRCCTNLLNFYAKLGVQNDIQFYDSFTFIGLDGKRSVLRGSFLPAPFHLLPSFLRFRLLSFRDKLRIASALGGILLRTESPAELDSMTMMEWLNRRGQTAEAIQIFWRPVLVSALNEDLERASARYGVKVMRDAFLSNAHAYEMGVPSVPLQQLYTEPALKRLEALGASLRLRCAVTRIEPAGSAIAGLVLSDGNPVSADYYISTLPPQSLAKLLPAEWQRYEYFGNLNRFGFSPITGIYLWFDREVTDLNHAAFPGRMIQWMFRKGSGHFGLVVSASRDLVPAGRSQLIERALEDFRNAIPEARDAKVVRSAVVKEPFATFSVCPGADQIRPEPQSPVSNLLVAGDWASTGWPPTMEGAVRSGYKCAELILQKEGISKSVLCSDDAPAALVRLLSRT